MSGRFGQFVANLLEYIDEYQQFPRRGRVSRSERLAPQPMCTIHSSSGCPPPMASINNDGGTDFTEIRVGYQHTCAVRTSGENICRGSASLERVSGPNTDGSTCSCAQIATDLAYRPVYAACPEIPISKRSKIILILITARDGCQERIKDQCFFHGVFPCSRFLLPW